MCLSPNQIIVTILVRIDDTGFAASYGEVKAKYYTLMAKIARLSAEADDGSTTLHAFLPEHVLANLLKCLRDREYRPKLVSLPQQYPDPAKIAALWPEYAASLVLDQGSEGACTGFGLAAVINYLLFQKGGETGQPVETVSPRMLFHLARSAGGAQRRAAAH